MEPILTLFLRHVIKIAGNGEDKDRLMQNDVIRIATKRMKIDKCKMIGERWGRRRGH